MPVSTVGLGARVEWTSGLLQLISTGGVPEGDGTSIEVDFVSNVVPLVGDELNVPLGDATNVPLQVGVGRSRRTVLQLSEVALKESNLVLVGGSWGVLSCGLDGEVVVDLALVDGSLGLGDEFGAQHGLAVPLCGLVDGDLDTLLRRCVGGVLEGGTEVYVVGDGTGAVDVVLVAADGVGEGPVGELGRGGHVVEAAIPDDFWSNDQ